MLSVLIQMPVALRISKIFKIDFLLMKSAHFIPLRKTKHSNQEIAHNHLLMRYREKRQIKSQIRLF